MTITDVIKNLKEGNQRYVDGISENKFLEKNKIGAEGSPVPYAVVLSCSESAVIAELLFDAGLGELYTVKVAGNVADAASIASIEYAIDQLSARLILILGHENCSIVKEAVQNGDNGYNLNMLLSYIKPAIAASGEGADLNDVVKNNVLNTITDLINRSDIIRAATERGELQILPAYYHASSGKVELL